jgi:hypothetical protein
MSFFSAPGEKSACAKETDSTTDLTESHSDRIFSSATKQKRLATVEQTADIDEYNRFIFATE